jgi:hypothetical protein
MVKPAILIIGFNRPQLLMDRLASVTPLVNGNVDIYVSIDGPRLANPNDDESIANILHQIEASPINNKINKWFSPTNSGCDVHIFNSITKVLEKHEIVVVIEDDIEVSAAAVNQVIEKARETLEQGIPNPIVTMSGLSRGFPRIKNRWRDSGHFSAWGFALNQIFWQLHTRNLQLKTSTEVEEKLNNSSNWQKLSKRKKLLWFERINRGNYDYGIQRTIFLNDLKSIAPVFRLSNNVGHGVSGASHTRFKTPWFLRDSVIERNVRFNKNHLEIGWKSSVLKWVDSQTWAGDGLLSVRGRNVGIRTVLKRITQIGQTK